MEEIIGFSERNRTIETAYRDSPRRMLPVVCENHESLHHVVPRVGWSRRAYVEVAKIAIRRPVDRQGGRLALWLFGYLAFSESNKGERS